MRNATSRLSKIIAKCALGGFLLVTTLAVFVPFNPRFPAAGLDPSWRFALNQAVAQGLVFGKDIVFTFGPYASVYTREYHPATDWIMLFGGFFLGLCYSGLLLLLIRSGRCYWLVLYLIALTSDRHVRDALLSFYPLILAVAAHRIAFESDDGGYLESPRLMTIGFAFLLGPLGLLPLIKGSLIVVSAAVMILCFCLFWYKKQKMFAYLSLAVPAACAMLFWTISGQPFSALPGFFTSMGLMISGYTEAMALMGNGAEIGVWLLAAIAILYAAASHRSEGLASRTFLFVTHALFLFSAFKQGFVRHDAHAITAGTAILLAVLSLSFVMEEKKLLCTVSLLALLAWGYIDKAYMNTSTGFIYTEMGRIYMDGWDGLKSRLTGPNKLKQIYSDRVSAIRQEFPIPKLPGTCDIYSFNQSHLLASENTWAPRPIFQSFGAYSPALAERNEKHLRSENSPDNILFRVETIDERLPSLDDGRSWPTLINNYSTVKVDGDLVYLRKRGPMYDARPGVEILNSEHELGEEVALPTTQQPLFAEIEISPSLIGRIRSLFFKPPELSVTLTLIRGKKRNYRIISGMAKSGFIISPLIMNTRDFVLLPGADNGWLRENVVKAIRISSSSGKSVFWKTSYRIRLRTVDLVRDTDVGHINLFDEIQDDVIANGTGLQPVSCDGWIDLVNGVPPDPAGTVISSLLWVEGWAAVAAKDGIVPDTVLLTLTDQSGKKSYVKARSTERSDIKKYFNHPEMRDPGFTAYIDVSQLSGKYSLGLAYIYKGKLGNRPQLQVPLLISHGVVDR